MKIVFWNKYLLYQITACLSSLAVRWQEGWARISLQYIEYTALALDQESIPLISKYWLCMGQSDLNAYRSWLCRLHTYCKHFSCGSENKRLYSCLAISSRITKGLCARTGACVCERDCRQINATATSAQGPFRRSWEGYFQYSELHGVVPLECKHGFHCSVWMGVDRRAEKRENANKP